MIMTMAVDVKSGSPPSTNLPSAVNSANAARPLSQTASTHPATSSMSPNT